MATGGKTGVEVGAGRLVGLRVAVWVGVAVAGAVAVSVGAAGAVAVAVCVRDGTGVGVAAIAGVATTKVAVGAAVVLTAATGACESPPDEQPARSANATITTARPTRLARHTLNALQLSISGLESRHMGLRFDAM